MENNQLINEALIEFGRNSQEKNFGQVIIFAGGAGSGKGFIKDNLLGNRGFTLDVDEIKKYVLRNNYGTYFKDTIMRDYGVDISKFDLKNPKDVSELHLLLGSKGLNLKDKKMETLFNSVVLAHKDRKPNLIFDITAKSYSDISELCDFSEKLGYDKNNINMLWVINDIEVASKQNADRERTIDDNLLRAIHSEVSTNMKRLVDKLQVLPFGGEVYFVFAKRDLDTKVATSKNGGMYLERADYIKVKEKGKSFNKNKIDDDVRRKISEYTQEKW